MNKKQRLQLKIGFIGAGALGTTLAIALSTKGYEVKAVSSRSRSSAERLSRLIPNCTVFDDPQHVVQATNFVLVTTPDDAISEVVSKLEWRSEQAVIHCSGAYSRTALAVAETQGASTGTLHPMQTFTDAKSSLGNLKGTFFGIEGDGTLLTTLKTLAHDLGGEPVILKAEHKPIYHASGMMACGFVLAMLQQASLLWETLGLNPNQAIKALLPMTRSTIQAAAEKGLSHALSGPLARGDTGTIQRHLEALREQAPQMIPIYCELALATLPLAKEKGQAEKSHLQEMECLLRDTLETETLKDRPKITYLEP